MQTLAFHTVDVFTTRPYTGNPLAIVLQADALSDQQMQIIATEFNLPETIFIQTPNDQENTAKVRIFTPVDEIPFAGHPTIGCAIFLAEQLHLAAIHSRTDDNADFSTHVRLEEAAGLVPVKVQRKQGQISAQLTAPVVPSPVATMEKQSALKLDAATAAQAIGIDATDINMDQAPPMAHVGGPTFLFVSLTNRLALSRAQIIEPKCTQLSKAFDATGIYVYYLDENTNEVDARMFAPATGIPEDPATGSATALLASQLHMANQLVEGNNRFLLRQGYDMGRPSDLLLDIEFVQGQINTVKVTGSSTRISTGNIRIP